VQEEVDRLLGLGVSKIVFVSHLQDVTNDKALVELLRGVDVAVAGGGDELLANAPAERLPGEAAPTAGAYPVVQADVDGKPVPIVTTAGNYKYLGRLDIDFDAVGNATVVSGPSGPKRVVPTGGVAAALGVTDAVEPDPGITTTVEEPITDCLAEFAATPVADTEVDIDVSRAGVRTRQANGGNLVADAWLASYDANAGFVGLPPRGVDNPVVAIQNGGGIRQNAGDILETGTISRLDVINVLPFDNEITTIADVTPAELKAVFELSGNLLPGQSGGFLQVAGISIAYDAAQPVGSRVTQASLADGRDIVVGGALAVGAPNVRIVTNDFTAAGGDGFSMLATKPTVTLRDGGGLAIPYEAALRSYLLSFPVGASGRPTITASDTRYAPFPNGAETRITVTTP
jgi:2',3'-cyclic-nucleotide 2'-phosphodiesterase (5'-nucleotidase family)